MTDELMTIGRFAHLSGLTVHALRHYDDVGLLAPDVVDPASGYRREQVRRARLILALRCLDLPIEEIRRVVDGGDATAVLTGHRKRLERQRDVLTARLGDVDRYLEEGITVSTPGTGVRPVQMKIAVDDAAKAAEFYQTAFDMRYEVTRRAGNDEYSSLIIGQPGTDGFFLIHLLDDRTDTDRLGPGTFGLLVPDLDEYHARAVKAGGTEVVAPRDSVGMPRNSAVKDPSGNWIWLYQE
ncbi:MerR family transcriptional regulator [Saccharothrix deserti]|uniref:MerR family transcriptional regulator n=1 Tax=Saccharothrix deserti TaxID=2593674 RepID=UPI00131D6E53|nr:MerR family transcriptional regulator [Saccharothrix deserti]